MTQPTWVWSEQLRPARRAGRAPACSTSSAFAFAFAWSRGKGEGWPEAEGLGNADGRYGEDWKACGSERRDDGLPRAKLPSTAAACTALLTSASV